MRNNSDNVIMSSAFAMMNKILKYVEEQLDNACFDFEGFTAAAFGITHNRFSRYLKMLLDSGYITGVEVIDHGEPDGFTVSKTRYTIQLSDSVELTIKGLQFLAENTAWAKMYKTVKGIRDLVP